MCEFDKVIADLAVNIGSDDGVDIAREDLYVILRAICLLDYEMGHHEATILENFPDL